MPASAGVSGYVITGSVFLFAFLRLEYEVIQSDADSQTKRRNNDNARRFDLLI